jgi:hypothetical protein
LTAEGVPYGVEAEMVPYGCYGRVRLDSSAQKRTIDGFDEFRASALVFEGSGWIQSVVGVNLSSKRAEIGLERFEYDAEIARTLADRQEARTLASKACTAPEALRMAP